MALEKKDFVQIEKIVEKSAEKTKTELRGVIKEEIEGLAIMVNKGFNETQKFNNQRFDKLEKKFSVLENDHEQIMLRLTNVAYRFELNEIKTRVEKLEKKVGIS